MSDETKHTPGPWRWVPDSWRGGFSGLFGRDESDVVVPQHANDGDDGAAWFEEISEANAHLIAAAPELYAALELMERLFSEGAATAPTQTHESGIVSVMQVRNMARAALAKARGEKTP